MSNYYLLVDQAGANSTATAIAVSDLNPLPVVSMGGSAGLTDAQLRATPVNVLVQNFPASQNVNGTVTANAGIGTFATSSAQLPGTLGQKLMTNSFAVVLASDQSAIPVLPGLTSAIAASVQTPVAGGTWAQLPPVTCKRVRITNTTGFELRVSHTNGTPTITPGTGVGLPIPSQAGETFEGITNANQLYIQRADISNTQLTVYFRAEA